MLFTDFAAPSGVLAINHTDTLSADLVSPVPPPWPPRLAANQTSLSQLCGVDFVSPDPPPWPPRLAANQISLGQLGADGGVSPAPPPWPK